MKRDVMTIYDYDDDPQIIKLPDKEITLVHVCVLSGDETGYVQFSDNTIMEFDASTCRMQSFYDGSYTVIGNDNLAKWFDWEPVRGGMNVDIIMEILDKLQFFGGQRADRELWADKPTDVQDADIDSFNENIEAIRDYIQRLEATVSEKEKVVAELSGIIGQLEAERNQLLEKIEMLETNSEE